jgi:hypothetical protein
VSHAVDAHNLPPGPDAHGFWPYAVPMTLTASQESSGDLWKQIQFTAPWLASEDGFGCRNELLKVGFF